MAQNNSRSEIRLEHAIVRVEDGLYCVYADMDGGELSYSTDTLDDARRFVNRLRRFV